MIGFRHAAIAIFTLAAPSLSYAQEGGQEPEAEKWDVSAPPLETRELPIDVDEGTWMSLDVSPDGQAITFDLLGDIYTIPMSGGEATSIASGMAWEIQPRFSPDGKKIAFTSDRGGGDNIWVMNADGTDKRQLTKESFRLLNKPEWTPDGEFIAARKSFTTHRSAGGGEIWLYHISGGAGTPLVELPTPGYQKEIGEPTFSADGEYLYYTQDITPGSVFIYAQDSNKDNFNIKRYEMKTGEVTTAVSGFGGSVRPAPSPDGRYMAFVRRERMQSKLYLKDLHSGVERVLYHDLDRDLQEIWSSYGLYPSTDWTPDSKSIVFWAGGKIRKLNVASGQSSIIPFRVVDKREVVDPPRPHVEVSPATFKTQMTRFANVSPNGRSVVFESLGKLYVKSLPGGTPKRLTRGGGDEFEFFPSWSRDGRRIAYVAWSDDDLGAIKIVGAGGGAGKAVTREPGHYRRPRFSPDGKSVVFEKGEGGYLTDREGSEAPGVYRISSSGGEAVLITNEGRAPHFGAGNDRVFMTTFKAREGTDNKDGVLVSVDLNGLDSRTHASGELVTEFQVAPSGKHLAFTEDYGAFVMPMLPGPQELGAGKEGTAFPITRATGDGGNYMHWTGDRLNWTLGSMLYSANVGDMFQTTPPRDEEEGGYEPPKSGVDLSITVTADKPTGSVALVGAKIITMADEDGGVIENGVILIEGDRIAAIGPASSITYPANTPQVDVAGRTIIPGLIDAHAHGAQGEDDIIPQQNWLAISHLAFGATTVFDPSNIASHFFTASEYQRAGRYLAPRMFSTGEIVYGAKMSSRFAAIDSYDDALRHVRRLKAQGAHGIKNYSQPRRDQRQQIVAAALAENIMVVAEGGAMFQKDLSMIVDGQTGIEHAFPQEVLYEDVVSFYSATKVAQTPTPTTAYGGIWGEDYWRQAMNVWEHPLVIKHAPPRSVQARSVRRIKAPDEDFFDTIITANAKRLADRGVLISIGAHGQQPGLGDHWELWSFVRGGFSPLEALRAGTIVPARHLGFERDIGSLEPGKLADLVILNADPLADIYNSDDISKVMLGGRLYDAATMNEEVTGSFKRAPYWWE